MIPPGWLIGQNGRQRHLSFSFLLKSLVTCFFLLLFFGVLSSAYSPLVHRFAGDSALAFSNQTLLEKISRDHWAAPNNLVFAKPLQPKGQIPEFQIWVNPEDFRQLNHQILLFGLGDLEKKPRIKGFARGPEGKVRPVSLGYRGTNSWHHQHWKPSLRIRFRKKTLSDGYRDHVLIAPEDGSGLRPWLTGWLARRSNLMTTEEHHLRVFLNQRFFGVYTRLWRLDESLTVNQGRLPGAFLRLEGNTGPVFSRQKAPYQEANSWQVSTKQKDENLIQPLVDYMKQPATPARLDYGDNLFDRKVFARWYALLILVADRSTGDHNIAFWHDPASGKLNPLVQDVNSFDKVHQQQEWQPVLRYRTGFMHQWLEDPRNLAATVDALHHLLTTTAQDQEVGAALNTQADLIRNDIQADPFMSGIGNDFGMYARTFMPLMGFDQDVQDIVSFMSDRFAFLNKNLAETTVGITQTKPDSFSILVRGLGGCTIQRADGQTFAYGPIPSPNLRHSSQAQVFPSLAPGLLPSPYMGRHSESFAFLTLGGQPGDYLFFHRLSGLPLKLDPQVPSGWQKDLEREGVHGAYLEQQNPPALVLGPGPVNISGKQNLQPGRTLVIKAGTELIMGPNASLLIRGPLQVQGTQEAPVFIRAEDPKRGFGVVALVGDKTGGSVIRHLFMKGGGTDRLMNLELSGMLSVHDCPDLIVENSNFSGNVVGDDAVHVIRSKAQFISCTFKDTLSDAMDWDKVEGSISDSRFLNCGNDCLDLSMGHVEINTITIHGAGDKGISAGEGVKLFLKNASIEQADIGLAAKDTAQVQLKNVELKNCRIGFAGYMKKWRWGAGGIAWFDQVAIQGSTEADIQGDNRSLIYLPWLQTQQLSREGKINLLPFQILPEKTSPDLANPSTMEPSGPGIHGLPGGGS